MKKRFCLLLALMMLGMAACNLPEKPEDENQMVTIYVPNKMTITVEGQIMTVEMIPEEGWLDKNSFTMQVRSENPVDSLGYDATYQQGKMILSYGEGQQEIEIAYDEAGRMISQILKFPEGVSILKNETAITYDSRGRKTKEESKIYYPDRDEPVTQMVEFTYTDTETGSKGIASNGIVEQELSYDFKEQLVKTITRTNGNEMTRTENTYNEHGNQVLSVTYVSGVETSRTETTYKTYEVTPEKAQKLSFFKQG